MRQTLDKIQDMEYNALVTASRQQKARGLFVSILLGKAPVSSVTRKPLGDLLVVTTEETGALLLWGWAEWQNSFQKTTTSNCNRHITTPTILGTGTWAQGTQSL